MNTSSPASPPRNPNTWNPLTRFERAYFALTPHVAAYTTHGIPIPGDVSREYTYALHLATVYLSQCHASPSLLNQIIQGKMRLKAREEEIDAPEDT